MMMEGTRLICTRDHMGAEVGDTGTCTFGSDYVPGLDAGRWTVEPDAFPAKSRYGHRAINYWTSEEMLGSWEVARDG
jgi:hypothetical protein